MPAPPETLTPEAFARAVVAAAKAKANRIDWSSVSAEEFVSRADLVGLPISDAQRALVRLAEGLPITHLTPPLLDYHCGALALDAPRKRPRIVYVESGRRSGKTLLAGQCGIVRPALTLPLRRQPRDGERAEADGLVGPSPGEPLHAPIVGPTLRAHAKKVLDEIRGRIEGSSVLSARLVDEKEEEFGLLRDDGRIVTVKALAAAPRGANIRGGWCVGGLFNEAAFFGQDDATVTLGDQIKALQPALVEGAQIWVESSPWDDSGEFARGHAAAFGAPDVSASFHSSSMLMNPTAISPDELAEQRRIDPEYVSREYDAIAPTGSNDRFFPEAAVIAACSREEPFRLPPNGGPHWAGADLGISKNSAALALARAHDGKTVLAYYEELIPQPGAPLSPKTTCLSFGKTCADYGAILVRGDSFYSATAIDEFAEVRKVTGKPLAYDVFHANAPNQLAVFTEFRRRMMEGLLVLPRDPRLIKQLIETKRKITATGMRVVHSSQGNAHGDLLMAVVLACVQVPPRAPGHVERSMSATRVLPF